MYKRQEMYFIKGSRDRANNVLSKFVSTFKRFCNKEYGENVWQSRFNDHIIRNNKDYEEHMQYIYENPARWIYDEMYEQNNLKYIKKL